jgi:GNAT superfamily N-acetyltransferase
VRWPGALLAVPLLRHGLTKSRGRSGSSRGWLVGGRPALSVRGCPARTALVAWPRPTLFKVRRAGPDKPDGRIRRVEISIRRAVSSDAAALARLRSVMFEAMQVQVGDRDSLWLAEAREWFTHQLATSDVAAFVAQTPDGGIVAAALGQVTRHAPSPANPSGVSGQLSNVVTDPEYRRLGLSRACVEQLLSWFRDLTDANDVGLFATDCGASLYESLGFGGRPNPAMSLNIRRG